VQKERIGESLDLVTSDFSVQYEKARSFEMAGQSVGGEALGGEISYRCLLMTSEG